MRKQVIKKLKLLISVIFFFISVSNLWSQNNYQEYNDVKIDLDTTDIIYSKNNNVKIGKILKEVRGNFKSNYIFHKGFTSDIKYTLRDNNNNSNMSNGYVALNKFHKTYSWSLFPSSNNEIQFFDEKLSRQILKKSLIISNLKWSKRENQFLSNQFIRKFIKKAKLVEEETLWKITLLSNDKKFTKLIINKSDKAIVKLITETSIPEIGQQIYYEIDYAKSLDNKYAPIYLSTYLNKLSASINFFNHKKYVDLMTYIK